ncbi:hypothetical protein EFL26_22565 [Nocardioides pocheonensis]|uniref:Uncharacterized protein n=1 Tax=Nocardioides pocheonensis TaxID=661485 RepID=A0A3N0GGB1_9ACTN|nr:hypothetical protein EFL26_22565 [Nocardioides pocheonensis]
MVLTVSESRGVRLVGPPILDLPVESLVCKACDGRTVTRDLPPIGIDVAAVLEQLAGVGRSDVAAPGTHDAAPTCACGAPDLTWSTVVPLTVHTAGTTMTGEVPTTPSSASPTGILSCAACSGSWDATHPDLPARILNAFSAFDAALSRGEVGIDG